MQVSLWHQLDQGSGVDSGGWGQTCKPDSWPFWGTAWSVMVCLQEWWQSTDQTMVLNVKAFVYILSFTVLCSRITNPHKKHTWHSNKYEMSLFFYLQDVIFFTGFRALKGNSRYRLLALLLTSAYVLLTLKGCWEWHQVGMCCFWSTSSQNTRAACWHQQRS